MKKIIFLALIILLAVSMTAITPAAGSFVESPSKSLAPELISFENESEACAADLIITAYAERTNLDDDARAALESAYNAIASAENLSANLT